MATTTTYSLEKPTVGGDENTWGGALNDNADKIDDLLDGTLAIKPNLDEGLWEVGGVAVTATAAELNILDGATVTTAELNILDGVTATAAEINLLDGVTWTLTDLNTITAAGKALLDDADAATQRTTLGLGDIATTDLIDEDSMATDSATRAPSQQSVKAYVDAGDANQIGVGQTWQTVTRSANTSYQNTTGKPIMVAITGAFNGAFAEVSTDNSTWVTIWQPGNNQVNTASFIVPDNHYYRVGSGGGSLTLWRELR